MRLASAQPDLRVILSLALLAEFIAPLVVFSVGALAPLLRDSLHLSREQIGSLTACFFAGVALAGIPMGWVADRYGVRSFLIAVQAVNGLGLIAISGLHTYAELLPLMFLAGLARGSVMILTTKALYEWFPRERPPSPHQELSCRPRRARGPPVARDGRQLQRQVRPPPTPTAGS